jgi:hypothetical protein
MQLNEGSKRVELVGLADTDMTLEERRLFSELSEGPLTRGGNVVIDVHTDGEWFCSVMNGFESDGRTVAAHAYGTGQSRLEAMRAVAIQLGVVSE